MLLVEGHVYFYQGGVMPGKQAATEWTPDCLQK